MCEVELAYGKVPFNNFEQLKAQKQSDVIEKELRVSGYPLKIFNDDETDPKHYVYQDEGEAIEIEDEQDVVLAENTVATEG